VNDSYLSVIVRISVAGPSVGLLEEEYSRGGYV
jgi:hypothetical protein